LFAFVFQDNVDNKNWSVQLHKEGYAQRTRQEDVLSKDWSKIWIKIKSWSVEVILKVEPRRNITVHLWGRTSSRIFSRLTPASATDDMQLSWANE